MRKILLCILIALGCHGWALGQDVLLNLSLAKDSIVVGDQVDLTLELSYNPSYNLQMPTLGDTLTPGIEIVHKGSIDTIRGKKAEDMIRVRQTLTLTSFDPGVIYSLPTFSFVVYTNGVPDTVLSNTVTLKVLYPPMDSTWTPNPIKPPIAYPTTLAEIATYTGIGLLALALLLLIIVLIYRYKHNKPLFASAKPKDPAHAVALRSLEQLKAEKLWQQDQIKEYYTRLSEIIRIYLEERYHVQAMEQTSDEIIEALVNGKHCPKELTEKLQEIFYTSDLVKFAKYTPPADEHEVCYTRIYQFVETTKVKEVATTQANNTHYPIEKEA